MKKQLLMITMLVSLGVIQNVKAHTQAKPIPNKTDANLMKELLNIRKKEITPKILSDEFKTLVANTSTVDLEVLVSTSNTWKRVPRNTYRVFFYKPKFYSRPKLHIRKVGETDPNKTLTLEGDQDNAITLIESVYGNGGIKEYRSARPRDILHDITLEKIIELEDKKTELANKYVLEKDAKKAEALYKEYQEVGNQIEQLNKRLK